MDPVLNQHRMGRAVLVALDRLLVLRDDLLVDIVGVQGAQRIVTCRINATCCGSRCWVRVHVL